MSSSTEENYLKAIFTLNRNSEKGATTSAIAKSLKTKASSVTDMIKKLSDKKLVNYKKYSGVTLTETGRKIAIQIIRKHRLWEVFLVNQLHFKWDEVHDIAEQLEHIKSDELTNRLDNFLGSPKFDPHGDPIPDKDGNLYKQDSQTLSAVPIQHKGKIVGVKDSSTSFLRYLESQALLLGTSIEVLEKLEYDDSTVVLIDNKSKAHLSSKVSQNLLISN